MNTELEARLNLETLQAEQHDKQAHLHSLDRQLKWAKVLTFCLYLAFAMALYVGDVWNLQTIITSFVSGAFGIVFFGVIAVLLAYVLAGTKHAAYTHFSMYKTVKLILLVAAFTGIMAEVFNSSGVQDVKARAVTQNNAEYQALSHASAGSGVSVSSDLAQQIARAEQILARCKVKEAAGKEKHCRGDAANVKALKEAQAAALQAQVMASTATQTERYQRLDQLKEEAYNPVIRAVGHAFSLEPASATALVMLLFAIVFELMHYYLSVMRRDVLRDLKLLTRQVQLAQVGYLNTSGYEYGHSPKPADAPTEKRQRWSVNPAMSARFNPSNTHLGGLSTSDQPQPTAVETPQPAQPEKLPFGFAPKRTPVTKAERPTGQKQGGTGRKNPVLGKAEYHYGLPLSECVSDASESASKSVCTHSHTLSAETPCDKRVHTLTHTQKQGLYSDWLHAIEADEKVTNNKGKSERVRTKRGTRTWIQKKVCPDQTGKQSRHLKHMAMMADGFFKRAIAQGVLKIRDDYKKGQRDMYQMTGE